MKGKKNCVVIKKSFKTGAQKVTTKKRYEKHQTYEFVNDFSVEQQTCKKWNQRSQAVTGDNQEATEINKELAIIKADILKHYNRMVALDKIITADLLKNEYLGTREWR